ncbi:MAG: hypothetical protein ACAI44_17070 [Candidatus Sericytochromatia bacterium]
MSSPRSSSESLIEAVKAFTAPFYAQKDLMHDASHIERLIKAALELAEGYAVDREILLLGAWFHGLVQTDEAGIRSFLASQGLAQARIEASLAAAWDSQKEAVSGSLEGQILHDAHLLEGGRTFLLVKCLVTGTARGQSLDETLDYLENHSLGRFTCHLPEARQRYAASETFAREVLAELRRQL